LKNNVVLSIVGGGLFLAFGVYNILFKKISIAGPEELESDFIEDELYHKPVNAPTVNRRNNALLFLKGFTLNLLNPGVVVYWLAIVAKGFDLVENHQGFWHIYVFIGIVLGVFFGFDCLKAYLANKLKPLVTVNLLKALNLLIGAVFIGTGVFLIVRQILRM